MKKHLLAFAAFLPAIALAECPALEYQELKDMTADALTKEFCSYSLKASNYTKAAATEHQYARDLRTINESSFDMQRSRDAGDAADKGAKLDESSQQCKSQIDRVQRVLVQKGLVDPSVIGLCK